MLKGAIVVVRGMAYNSLPKSQAVGPPNVKQTAYVHMSICHTKVVNTFRLHRFATPLTMDGLLVSADQYLQRRLGDTDANIECVSLPSLMYQ